ncbi:CBU_0592 family membrane protein [Leucobacter sp. GX24907]
MNTVDAVGWIGTTCLILGYALVSARGKAPGLGYQLLNLIGATGLVINAIYHGALPVVGLNAVWMVIGIVAVVRLLVVRSRERVEAQPGSASLPPRR